MSFCCEMAELREHAVLGAQRCDLGGVVSLETGHVGFQRGLEVVRSLARNDQVRGGDQRVVEVAGPSHRHQQGVGLSRDGDGEGRQLGLLHVDLALCVGDIGLQLGYLGLERGDLGFLVRNVRIEVLLARSRLKQGDAQLLLARQRPGHVAAQALAQLGVGSLVWIRGRRTGDPRAGCPGSGLAWACRVADRNPAWCEQGDEGAECDQSRDSPPHARIRRNPSIAVSAPSARPATMTAAAT